MSVPGILRAGVRGAQGARLPAGARTWLRSYPAWALGAALAGILIAAALPAHPHMVTGLVGGGLVLMLLLLRPLLLLGAVLAVGVLNLSFLTGGERQLLSGMGGLDMNGIRLLGFVAGFSALLLIDRRMLEEALGRHGRWYLLFLGYAAGTLAMSPSTLEGLRLLMKLAFPFLIFLGVRGLVRSRRQLDRLGSWTLAAAAVLVLLVNPVLVAQGGYFVDSGGALHVSGLGNHHNPFSQYLLAMVFLAVARYIFRADLRYLLLALALGVWMILAQSRITLLAALVGLAAMAVYGAVLRRNFRPLVATAVLAAAVAIPLTPLVLERTFGYAPTLAELVSLAGDPAALAQSISWMGRDRIWPVLYAGFLSSPIVGLGLGASAPLLRSSFSTGVTDLAHNEYLRVAVDTGVVGLGLLAVAVLVWWVASARAGLRVPDPLVREYAVAAVAVVPAAAIFALTSNPIDYYSQFTQYIGFFTAGALGTAALRGGVGGKDGIEGSGAGGGDRAPAPLVGPAGSPEPSPGRAPA